MSKSNRFIKDWKVGNHIYSIVIFVKAHYKPFGVRRDEDRYCERTFRTYIEAEEYIEQKLK